MSPRGESSRFGSRSGAAGSYVRRRCPSCGKSDWTPLAGRDVVIVPDADKAGAKYAAEVSAILVKLSPPARVRVIDLRDTWSDLPVGGDIADVVDRGEDPDAIKTKLAALLTAAEPEAPAPRPPAVERFKPFPTDALPKSLRGFVTELAAATGTDPACASLTVLVVLAGAIGNRVAAQVKRGWTEAAILQRHRRPIRHSQECRIETGDSPFGRNVQGGTPAIRQRHGRIRGRFATP